MARTEAIRAAGNSAEFPASRKRQIITVSPCDKVMLFTVIVLVFFGLIMIFSSSFYLSAQNANNMFSLLIRQGVASIMGIAALLFFSFLDYRLINKRVIVWGSYIAANALMVYAGIFGRTELGASRWINLPVFGSFQPSELAKIVVIIVVAHYISLNRRRATSWRGILFCMAVTAVPCIIAWKLTNNFSTALIMVAVAFIMIFVASPAVWPFVMMSGLGVSAVVLFLSFGDDFRAARFQIWKNPWIDPTDKGLQVIQSLYAVASGGLFGLGLGQSRQKLRYLPESFNDFIFAVICEELGFFGAAALLLLFAALIWRGIIITINAMDLFGSFVALGAVTLVATQVLINVAVVTNTIPTTGIPLPFISYGGSSILFILALMGIVLNISRYRSKMS